MFVCLVPSLLRVYETIAARFTEDEPDRCERYFQESASNRCSEAGVQGGLTNCIQSIRDVELGKGDSNGVASDETVMEVAFEN